MLFFRKNLCYNEGMEKFNKNLPFFTAVVGFGILLFSIFNFINGVKTDLNTRMADLNTRMTDLGSRMNHIETKIQDVRTELKADVREVRTELNTRMDRVETRMEGIEDKLDQLILLQAKQVSGKIAKSRFKKPKTPHREPAHSPQKPSIL